MTHRYSKYFKEINLIGDILFLNFAYFLVYFFSIGEFDTLFRSAYFELQLFFNIAWIASAYFIKVHDTSRIASIERVIRKLLNALGLYLILIFAFLGIKDGSYYKLFVFYTYCSTSVGLTIFNIGFVLFQKYYRSVGYNYRKVIIVGYGKISTDLRKYFTYNPELGYRFMGYFDNHSSNSVIRGQVSEIPKISKTLEIDEIYCILPYLDYHEVEQLTKFAEDNFIKIHAIPDYRGFPYKNIEVQLYDVIPVLNFPAQPLDDQLNRFIKRAFDIIFSVLFMVFVLSWLVPLVALLIKMDSKGPAVFKQLRSGINNEPFTCYKFRTMEVNEDSDNLQATKTDSRITKFGSLLRKTNIDEIPQFLNVLKGEMSVVGPRPHMLKHTEAFSKQVDKFMLRHYV
ncbi:MAG: exopolysaccharide biosynthesis polyprenyl glycosylphosphotransferase, partial [Cyclobacteriaceae bacterium]|nr:exopolysaccharide biosynthesis polyprenyl glycosylphosphotransferase [Cyclobacteriaceae bacterium]